MLATRYAKRFAFLLIPAVLVGCAAQPPVPEDKYYRLQAVPASAPLVTPLLDGTLEVERFSADGLTAGRPIVYVEDRDPNQLQEYHYHFWTQAPTIMLRDELVTYLRAVNVAKNVVTPEMRLNAEYVLTGRIRRFEQIKTADEGAVIEIEFALRRPADNRLLFLKSYRNESKQQASGVAGAVRALNEGWNLILADLLADLRKL